MPDPIRTDRVRVMSFLKRKAGISVEEFRRYWESPHAEDFLSLDITKKNIIKYERAYPNSKYIADAESKGFPVPDWDGVVLLDGESYEKILEVFLSDEYKKIVAPGDGDFVDLASCRLLPLDVVTVIE